MLVCRVPALSELDRTDEALRPRVTLELHDDRQRGVHKRGTIAGCRQRRATPCFTEFPQ